MAPIPISPEVSGLLVEGSRGEDRRGGLKGAALSQGWGSVLVVAVAKERVGTRTIRIGTQITAPDLSSER
jgi:hypothetical protein